MINGSVKCLIPKGTRCKSEAWGVGPGVQTNRISVAAKTERRQRCAGCLRRFVGRIMYLVLGGEQNQW